MSSLNLIKTCSIAAFDNDNSVFIIEQWAQDSLLTVEENMVAANLVYRDFDEMIARKGETVTSWIPGAFLARRKEDGDSVQIQDAVSYPVSVKLNQHVHVSFVLNDGEESKAYKDLKKQYLKPACQAIARGVDRIVLAQIYQFLGETTVGKIGTIITSDTLVDATTALDDLEVPVEDRVAIVTSATKGQLLKDPAIKNADKSGDGGQALRSGELGSDISGFAVYMAQGTPSIKKSAISVTSNTADSAVSAGSTVIPLGLNTGVIEVGTWVIAEGDGVPRRVVNVVDGGGFTSAITVDNPTTGDIAAGAAVDFMDSGAVNNASGYPVEYVGDIAVDAFSTAIRTGQAVSTADKTYAAINSPSLTSIELDIPLEAALANDDTLFSGPYGEFNIAFNKNAIALVTRPLAAPSSGAGALSYVATYNDLAMRVTISYNGVTQGHLVTVDLLCGVKTLNPDLGVVVLG